jgi:hypothetical protein
VIETGTDGILEDTDSIKLNSGTLNNNSLVSLLAPTKKEVKIFGVDNQNTFMKNSSSKTFCVMKH